MKTLPQIYVTPLSVALMLPAVVFCGSGVLHLFWEINEANQFLEILSFLRREEIPFCFAKLAAGLDKHTLIPEN